MLTNRQGNKDGSQFIPRDPTRIRSIPKSTCSVFLQNISITTLDERSNYVIMNNEINLYGLMCIRFRTLASSDTAWDIVFHQRFS
jgi:hypothetical protein